MRLYICGFLLFFSVSPALANTNYEEDSLLLKPMGSLAISGISSALSQADVALCKSMIYLRSCIDIRIHVYVSKIELSIRLKCLPGRISNLSNNRCCLAPQN